MTTTCEHGQQFYCDECKNAGKPTPGEVGRTDSLTTLKDMFIEVTGQLAALEQANSTLVEKWRKEVAPTPMNKPFEVGYATGKDSAADELQASTKEATP